MIERITTGSFFTNSYIISNDKNECVVVDPGLGYAEAAKRIKEKYTVVAILITHGHMDHIDGIQYFDAPIYIHKLDEEFLYNPSLSLYNMMGMRCPFKKGELIVNTIGDGDVIELIGYSFKVMHTPGHTRGCVCYSYTTKVLSGDTLFNGSCGRVDFPTGDALKMRNSLQRIIKEYPDNYDVYPGHDEKTTIKREKNGNPYIR